MCAGLVMPVVLMYLPLHISLSAIAGCCVLLPPARAGAVLAATLLPYFALTLRNDPAHTGGWWLWWWCSPSITRLWAYASRRSRSLIRLQTQPLHRAGGGGVVVWMCWMAWCGPEASRVTCSPAYTCGHQMATPCPSSAPPRAAAQAAAAGRGCASGSRSGLSRRWPSGRAA
jgi:hypothetical protein